MQTIDPKERLGARAGGYAELKSHPFFEGIDWENIHNETPPPMGPPDVLPIFLQPVVEKQEEPAPAAAPVESPERREKLELQKKSIWARFLNDDELILENSLVTKQRGLSKTKRQLLLTDKPQ